MSKKTKNLSRFLSLVLRHKPEEIGIELDEAGWVDISVLLKALSGTKGEATREIIQEVVDTSEKQRFAISDDGLRIRANQGHSVDVDLKLEEVKPPLVLFHGTVSKFLDPILKDGLIKGQRHAVHLSEDTETAEQVGSRRGKPVILQIFAHQMFDAGHKFYKSENGVYLTDHVPPKFIMKPPSFIDTEPKDKFDVSGPWETIFEGISTKIGAEEYCGFVKEEEKFGETLHLPVGDLCIKPGRRVRITVEVLE